MFNHLETKDAHWSLTFSIHFSVCSRDYYLFSPYSLTVSELIDSYTPSPIRMQMFGISKKITQMGYSPSKLLELEAIFETCREGGVWSDEFFNVVKQYDMEGDNFLTKACYYPHETQFCDYRVIQSGTNSICYQTKKRLEKLDFSEYFFNLKICEERAVGRRDFGSLIGQRTKHIYKKELINGCKIYASRILSELDQSVTARWEVELECGDKTSLETFELQFMEMWCVLRNTEHICGRHR